MGDHKCRDVVSDSPKNQLVPAPERVVDPTKRKSIARARAFVASGLSLIPIRADGTKMPAFELLPPHLDDDERRSKTCMEPRTKIGVPIEKSFATGFATASATTASQCLEVRSVAPRDHRLSRNACFGDGHVKLTQASSQTPSVQDCPDMNLTPGGISGSDLR